MLQWIERIRAARQFRRLLRSASAEPLLGDELAQLEASWVQMRVETLMFRVPGGAKYAFGWEDEPVRYQEKSGFKQAPQRPPSSEVPDKRVCNRPSDQEPATPPSAATRQKPRYQPPDQGPREYYQYPAQASPAEKAEWFLAFTRQFRKDIDGIDRKLQGRVLEAISEICQAPVTAKGDTVKPLVGDMTELWRYRIGDFRLIYHPDVASQRVTLLQFAGRGSVYD